MGNTIQIKLAGTGDAALIADLSRRTFYDSFAAANTKEDMDHFMNEQFSREQLMAQVGAPGMTFLLAWFEDASPGEPVGYACLRDPLALPDGTADIPPELPAGRQIEIARIYAEQHTIGKGVGKALMQRCLELAAEKGREWAWLGVWEHNARAIAFYKSRGFEKFSEHSFLLGHDRQTDWLMKIPVPPASGVRIT